MPRQAEGRTFMWSAADPCTGEHGPQGLYGEMFLFDLIMVCRRGRCWDHSWSQGKDNNIWSQKMPRNAEVRTSGEVVSLVIQRFADHPTIT